MNFPTAITTCFSKFATFSGRATRSEFWWFYLFTLLLSWFAHLALGAGIASVVSLVLFSPCWLPPYAVCMISVVPGGGYSLPLP